MFPDLNTLAMTKMIYVVKRFFTYQKIHFSKKSSEKFHKKNFDVGIKGFFMI